MCNKYLLHITVERLQMSIATTAYSLIVANPSAKNKEIATMIRELHPDAKTTDNCIAWYKSNMKKKNITVEATVTRTSKVIQEEIEMLQEELEEVLEQEKQDAISEAQSIEDQIKMLQARLALTK